MYHNSVYHVYSPVILESRNCREGAAYKEGRNGREGEGGRSKAWRGQEEDEKKEKGTILTTIWPNTVRACIIVKTTHTGTHAHTHTSVEPKSVPSLSCWLTESLSDLAEVGETGRADDDPLCFLPKRKQIGHISLELFLQT